jgi:DNA-binding CsgD family transcriptional regulator
VTMHLFDPDFTEDFLAAIRSILPLAGASCYAVDDQGNPIWHRLSGLPLAQLRDYRRRFYMTDPFHPARHDRDRQTVVAADQAYRAIDPRPYLEGFLRGHGFCDEIELFFRDGSGRIVAGVGLFRDDRLGMFRAADFALLQRMMPLLELTVGERLNQAKPEMRWESSTLVKALTRRERQITALLIRGLSNKEISEQCEVSISTVKAHLVSIFEKTSAASRADLTAKLLMAGRETALTEERENPLPPCSIARSASGPVRVRSVSRRAC